MYRRQTPSLYMGESVSLLYGGGKRLLSSLYSMESVSSICRGGRLLLCIEGRVSLFSIEEADSSLYSMESVSLLYGKDADSFSIQKGDSLTSL